MVQGSSTIEIQVDLFKSAALAKTCLCKDLMFRLDLTASLAGDKLKLRA
jgi:hypothetical protein